jgi:chaperonin GroES
VGNLLECIHEVNAVFRCQNGSFSSLPDGFGRSAEIKQCRKVFLLMWLSCFLALRHVIRSVEHHWVLTLQSWLTAGPACVERGGCFSVVSFEISSTGQEKIMAKKASSGGTRIVPLGDRVVLKRAEAEAKTAGGIVLPESAQGKPQRGEIVAVGDGHVNDKGEKIPLTVKEGDRVIFSSYAGDEISFGDQTFLLMRESDILAVL